MLDLGQHLYHPRQGFLISHIVDCCQAPKQLFWRRQPHRRFGFVTKYLLSLIPHQVKILHIPPPLMPGLRRLV